tara:strand:+ start:410 stop:796 length:387 start_codon:yes stop_codon:yes gene_type:complete
MREIKFRALAGVGKTWFYWDVYGDYPQGVYGGLSEPQQYTGLKDKDGVEIYEGDFLEYIGPYGVIRTGTVEYEAPIFRAMTEPVKGRPLLPTYNMIDIMPSDATYPYQRLKVTGNVNEQIHEWMTNAP